MEKGGTDVAVGVGLERKGAVEDDTLTLHLVRRRDRGVVHGESTGRCLLNMDMEEMRCISVLSVLSLWKLKLSQD